MKIIIFIALLLAVSYTAGTCDCNDGEYFIAANTAGKASCKNYPTAADKANPHKYVENCTLYTFDGTNAICGACKPAFYLKGNACVVNSIKDCEVQADDTICTYCSKLFFKVDGYPDTCTSKVTTAVQDCKYHASATECEVCDAKFNLNTGDKTKCVAQTVVANCDVPTAKADGSSICLKCKSTHPVLTAGVCSAIEKCSKYGVNKCTECPANFFVNADGSKCVAYPTGGALIADCEKYETNNTGDEFKCMSCAANKHLNADQTKCIAFPTSISDCTVYVSNGTGDESKCQKCADTHYVNFNGSKCILLTNKTAEIPECLEYVSNGADDGSVCGKCKANFYTNKGSLKCVAYPSTDGTKIAGCSTYVSNGTADEFKCGGCEAKKWFKTDGSACIDQTVNEQCAKFEWNGTAESCPMCVDKAYDNLDSKCAVCPTLTKKGDDDKKDDDKKDDDKKDDDKKDDDKKEDEKDKNNSASIVSVCLASIVLVFVVIV